MSDEVPFTADSSPAERLSAVRERLGRAAERSGRDPAGISLVAVSKKFPPARVIALAEAGQLVFGENRVQEAREKIPATNELWTGPALTWRMVGHLQRNKVRQALDVFDTLDGVDSFRLLDAVEAEAERRDQSVPVLLEFNCSGEAAKSGFDPAEKDEVARRIRELKRVEIRGLMTMGPLADDPETARPAFRMLREIREALEQAAGRALPELSMGMSDDLEVGVEEGATMVRVGTALFGPRPAVQ
jgi:pyridoxal phosphate enzyme (YggS family)